MKVALTGATGFVGSHILAELQAHGHEVTALVRDDAQSDAVAARGRHPGCRRSRTIDPPSSRRSATRTAPSTPPVRGMPPARTWIPRWSTRRSRHSMGQVSPISISAAGGSTVRTRAITEDSPLDAPAMVSWREPIERRVLDAGGMRGVVITSGVAYGDGGGGVPGVLLGSPRDPAGNLIMLGTGKQHWSTVHVADLADFFRRVLESDSARGRYVISNGLHPTVAELTEAAAVATGAPGAVPGSDEEARASLGDYFAEVLLLDQGDGATRAQSELGWLPTHPGLDGRVPPRQLPPLITDRLLRSSGRGSRIATGQSRVGR